jgi:RNA polymerase sigma-70 factor (ECF subfamily)
MYNRAPMVLSKFRIPLESADEDAQWILRCQAGDASAFRQLVERYERRAWCVAFHMVGHDEDARDIVQEAFIRVYRALPRFRVGKRFFTWFYRIILHLAIDHMRRCRERGALGLEAADAEGASTSNPSSDPVRQALRDEASERVQRLLEKLPERDRAVLVLRDIEGLSAVEIAEIVGSNPATVRWWLFLARKQFRHRWESLYGEEDTCV